MMIPHPIITLKEGKAIENMEEILSKYCFRKQEGHLCEPEYLLVNKEDPSLVSIVNFYDSSNNNEKYMGVAIVSSSGETNRDILAQLEERLGIQLRNLRTIGKTKKAIHIIKDFYGDKFLELVLSQELSKQ